MPRRHPLFDELDASLAALIPAEPVELAGGWIPSVRRAYESACQDGTGTGPFREVVDVRWHGALTGANPIAGVAFLLTATHLFWGKSHPAAARVPVDVSLHAYADADASAERATFAAAMGGMVLPGVPVACGVDLAASVTIKPLRVPTGRVELLAEADAAAFFVVLIPAPLLEVGRHRLWRLREKLATSLPPRSREILTRRRTGWVPCGPPVL